MQQRSYQDVKSLTKTKLMLSLSVVQILLCDSYLQRKTKAQMNVVKNRCRKPGEDICYLLVSPYPPDIFVLFAQHVRKRDG